jgi:hypothetical protein
MSGGGFHVHGPHDHEVEHATQHAHHEGGGGMINQIAMFTAVIATVGAIFAYMGGATQANAGLYTKQSLAELARDLAPEDKKAGYQAKVDRYEKEKGEIKAVADKLEAEATTWDKASDEQMHLHHRWAQATTALQVAIALAAIALLTKKKWLEYGMFGVAGIGVAIGGLAIAHI